MDQNQPVLVPGKKVRIALALARSDGGTFEPDAGATVEWTVEDSNLASVLADPANMIEADLTIRAEGTTTVKARTRVRKTPEGTVVQIEAIATVVITRREGGGGPGVNEGFQVGILWGTVTEIGG